jgi:hypothetical protein
MWKENKKETQRDLAQFETLRVDIEGRRSVCGNQCPADDRLRDFLMTLAAGLFRYFTTAACGNRCKQQLRDGLTLPSR